MSQRDLSFAELVAEMERQHGRQAYWVARLAIGGPRAAVEAEDVVQEAFVRLLEHGEPFKWPQLALTIHNLVKNGWRERTRRNRREQVAAARREETNVEPEFKPEKVWSTIGTLPPQERRVLVAYYYGGLSGPEVARAEGVSDDEVYRCLERARDMTRQSLLRGGVVASGAGLERVLAEPLPMSVPPTLKARLLSIQPPAAITSTSTGSLAVMATLAAAGVLGAVAVGLALNSGSSTPAHSPMAVSSVDTSAPARAAQERQEEPPPSRVDSLVASNSVATATPVDAPGKTFGLPLVAPPATEEEATEALALLRVIRSLQGNGADARRRYLSASRLPRHVAELEFGRQASPAAARADLYQVVANAVVVDVGRFPEDSPLLCLLASVLTGAPDDCPEEVQDSSALRLLARHIAATAPAGSVNRASAVAILGAVGTSGDAVHLASNRDALGMPSRRTLTSVSVSHILTRTAALGISTLAQRQFAELEQAVSYSGNVAENVTPGSLLSPRRWGAAQGAEEEISITRASRASEGIAGIDFRQQPPVGFGYATRALHREAEAEWESYNFRCLACPGHSELRVDLYSEKPLAASRVELHCVAADRPWLPKSDVLVRVELDDGAWHHDQYYDVAGPHWLKWPVMPACAPGAHTLRVKLLRGTTTFRVKELRLVAAE